ncbi:MAG: phosphatidylglycerophosphatase A, partial [Saprospiraceae bacterium]
GVWIAMLGFAVDAWHLLAAFLLFRFFDIAKPLGIRRLERLENGWGVMLDDVAAGLAANLVLWVLQLFFFKT